MLKRITLINLILALTDIAVLYVTFQAGIILRNLLIAPGHLRWIMIAPVGQSGFVFLVLIFWFFGLYPGYGLTAVKELERVSKATTLLFIFLAVFLYLNKPFYIYPRSFLIFSWMFLIVLLPLARFVVRNLLSRLPWYGIPVVIFGTKQDAEEIATLLRRIRRLGWQPVAILPSKSISNKGVKDHWRNLGSTVAIFLPSKGASINQYASRLNQYFRKVILIQPVGNLGSTWVEPRDLDGRLGLEFHYHLLERSSIWIKRAIDLAGASFLLFLLSPLFGFLTLLIAVDSPGPIFFRQERTGQNFKHYKVLKFRTMVENAEQKLQQLLKESPEIRSEFERYHKLEQDPRITRAGKLLRRFYLDELPQLWNILKGDMSFVGPRPVLDYEIKKMETYAPIILRVKPGITGWWQVTGRHQVDFLQRVRMEEYYISNWSLWMDMFILLKTIWVVLSAKGT